MFRARRLRREATGMAREGTVRCSKAGTIS